ncbi:reverse transcriptase domain-containing protein [Tanacetum coccineum]
MIASFFQMSIASTSGTRSLNSNTVANPNGESKAITTQSGLVLDGPTILMPPPFVNPEEGIARDVFVPVRRFTFLTDFIIVDYKSDPRVPLILGRPFLRTARALIDVHRKEMILRDVNDNIFDPKGDIIENLLNFDKTKDLLPYHDNPLSGNPTLISSPTLISFEESDLIWEEFEAYLVRNDYLPFDIESDLREIEYLLNHDPIKETDSILEDLVDENSLDDNLVDTTSEMFTDEHALDYSSPPLWDDYDDDLFDLDTVNDNTYGDPFDFKEEKIKYSKILIDELDSPESSDFLPLPECDSIFYEDFFKDDALPSTNNEDKVFNPGILIHENLYEVTNVATPDKNVKNISYASSILEDFNPLSLYELPFHKEVPRYETLLLFSSENEEKCSTPGFSLLKEFILHFSKNYLIGTLKPSKSLNILKAR